MIMMMMMMMNQWRASSESVIHITKSGAKICFKFVREKTDSLSDSLLLLCDHIDLSFVGNK